MIPNQMMGFGLKEGVGRSKGMRVCFLRLIELLLMLLNNIDGIN
jgi:hypothetical protein